MARHKNYIVCFGAGSNDRSERTESKSRPMMHSIVAVGLIVSVVLGSIAGSFFISYKIVDETRCAVSKMHEAINASPQKENLGVWLSLNVDSIPVSAWELHMVGSNIWGMLWIFFWTCTSSEWLIIIWNGFRECWILFAVTRKKLC